MFPDQPDLVLSYSGIGDTLGEQELVANTVGFAAYVTYRKFPFHEDRPHMSKQTNKKKIHKCFYLRRSEVKRVRVFSIYLQLTTVPFSLRFVLTRLMIQD